MSFNLRVGKNDPLRERLLTGSLLPSELVRLAGAGAFVPFVLTSTD